MAHHTWSVITLHVTQTTANPSMLTSGQSKALNQNLWVFNMMLLFNMKNLTSTSGTHGCTNTCIIKCLFTQKCAFLLQPSPRHCTPNACTHNKHGYRFFSPCPACREASWDGRFHTKLVPRELAILNWTRENHSVCRTMAGVQETLRCTCKIQFSHTPGIKSPRRHCFF